MGNKHFCIKWLGAHLKILLEGPPPSIYTATMTPTAIGCEDVSQPLLPLTIHLQPLNYAPIVPKPDPITPNSTQTTAKLPANNTKPETAMETTSNMMADMYKMK